MRWLVPDQWDLLASEMHKQGRPNNFGGTPGQVPREESQAPKKNGKHTACSMKTAFIVTGVVVGLFQRYVEKQQPRKTGNLVMFFRIKASLLPSADADFGGCKVRWCLGDLSQREPPIQGTEGNQTPSELVGFILC